MEEVSHSRPVALSLVGMPGGGKSTAGRHLAQALGMGFVDSDVAIERQARMSVRAYFDAWGERSFRDLEESVIESLTQESGRVIATGGGVVLREANRRALHERTTVIYLRSSPEVLFRRLRHDTRRPLLQVDDPLGKLRELYQERDPLYRACAHFVVETGRPSIPTIVNMILAQLELAGIVNRGDRPSARPAQSV
jgi:shikimate kinase